MDDPTVLDVAAVAEEKASQMPCSEKHPGMCGLEHADILDDVETFRVSVSRYLKATGLTTAPDGTVLLCVSGQGFASGEKFSYWLLLSTQLLNPMFQVPSTCYY